MCQRGHRVLLSDSGHAAQRWWGLHPRRPARTRLTDSRHRLLLVRVTHKRTQLGQRSCRRNSLVSHSTITTSTTRDITCDRWTLNVLDKRRREKMIFIRQYQYRRLIRVTVNVHVPPVCSLGCERCINVCGFNKQDETENETFPL